MGDVAQYYELTLVGLESVFERVRYLDSIKRHATHDAIVKSVHSILSSVSRALKAADDRSMRKNA
jgi:hypothetical protein